MNYYLRQNGSVAGPMEQAEFLARIASGAYSATDEMSTDGVIWTRLGLTGYARSIQAARVAATPRVGAVVPDLTGYKPSGGVPPPPPTLPPVHPPVVRRGSAVRKTVSVLAVLLVIALGALAWFFLRPPEKPEGAGSWAIPSGADGDLEVVLAEAVARDRAAADEQASETFSVIAAKASSFRETAGKNAVGLSGASGVSPRKFAAEAFERAQRRGPEAAAVQTDAVSLHDLLSGQAGESSPGGDASISGEAGDFGRYLVPANDPLLQKAVRTYFAPTKESQELLLLQITHSGHVREKFPDEAAKTRFEYLSGDDLVNADSSMGRDAGGDEFGRIRLYGGLVRMSRVMGAVMCCGNLLSEGEGEDTALQFFLDFGEAIREAGNHCSDQVVATIAARYGVDPAKFASPVFRNNAEKVANAIVESVLAHEFGHIAKGHLKGGDANHVVTQIEEKEADLFASTIAASVPEGNEVFAGQLLSMLVFSFIDDGSGDRLRTHPVPRERVIDAIRANPEIAAASGITEEAVRELFEKLDQKKQKEMKP